MAVLSTMHLSNTALIHQYQRAVVRRDYRRILDDTEQQSTSLAALDEPISFGRKEYDGEEFVGHFLQGAADMDCNYHSSTIPTRLTSVYGQPRTHGPKDVVWHCHDCGYGPYGNWQNVCVECNHKRCSSCETEEAS